jgi:hypothetical protein
MRVLFCTLIVSSLLAVSRSCSFGFCIAACRLYSCSAARFPESTFFSIICPSFWVTNLRPHVFFRCHFRIMLYARFLTHVQRPSRRSLRQRGRFQVHHHFFECLMVHLVSHSRCQRWDDNCCRFRVCCCRCGPGAHQCAISWRHHHRRCHYGSCNRICSPAHQTNHLHLEISE